MDPSKAVELINDAQIAVGAVALAWLAFRSLRRLWSRMISKDPAL